MTKPIRWGILGAGNIARAFAEGLKALPDAELTAVASRTQATGREFAKQINVRKVYTGYNELVRDPNVDVIYVATPHQRHFDDCTLVLEAGKPVLCEKPFTVNAKQARALVDLARRKDLFLMEAMWMRCMPLIRKVKELVDSGAIGDIRMLTAEFSVPTHYDPQNRFFDPKQGGGALLDRGVYTLALASLLMGEPVGISGEAAIGPTGVDEQSAMVLRYAGGRMAVLSAGMRTYSSNSAAVMGTRGRIVLHEPFYAPQRISISTFGEPQPASKAAPSIKQKMTGGIKKNPLVRRAMPVLRQYLLPLLRKSSDISQPLVGNGYNYEAAEVMRCLRAGERESPMVPLNESVRVMEQMDTLRAAWGLKYPGE